MRAATDGDTSTLDPQLAGTLEDVAFTQMAYENLALRMQDLSLRPMLAVAWEAGEDLTSYTFRLREGVRFHHGKEFKAEDVVYTFKRLLDSVTGSPGASSLDYIGEPVALDDHTVWFNLRFPNAFLPDNLSISHAKILPADIDPSRLATEKFGTGPFILKEYVPGERLAMKRNDDYWMVGRPYLDEVIVFYINDETTRIAALRAGKVDALFSLRGQSVADFEANPEIVVSEVSSSAYMNLAMDMRVPPFDNILVRKALQAATDRQAILDGAQFGLGGIAYDHPITPTDPVFNPSCKPPDYDPQLAREFLAQAGYPNGIDLTLYTSQAGANMVEMAKVFAETARPAGININIEVMPEDRYWSDGWMVKTFTTVWWGGRPPYEAFSVVYKSDAVWNESFYRNDQLDTLLNKALGQGDLVERAKIFGELQCIVVDEVPRIIPVFRPELMAMRADVKGLQAHPQAWPLLHDVWLSGIRRG